MKFCSNANCKRSFKNHRWGSIKAHSEGWFQEKDGAVWCPDHIPDWVEEWRKSK